MCWSWLEQRTSRDEVGAPHKVPMTSQNDEEMVCPTWLALALEVSDVAIKHATSIPSPLFNQGKMALVDAIPRPIHREHEEAVIVDDAVAKGK